MVRILHFADLHLGAESYGRFDPETGLSTRLGDFLAALDRIVDYALNNDIHLVLFAGDAYKTCDPSPTHQREFARRIGSLGRAGIPTVLLTGNHDVPNARGRANTVEIFEALAAENVYVCGRPETLRLDTRGGPVQIVTLPWFNRSTLLAKDEHRNQALEEIEETILEKIERIVAEQVAELDARRPGDLPGAWLDLRRGVQLGAQDHAGSGAGVVGEHVQQRGLRLRRVRAHSQAPGAQRPPAGGLLRERGADRLRRGERGEGVRRRRGVAADRPTGASCRRRPGAS